MKSLYATGLNVGTSTIVSDYRKISDLILSQALSLGLSPRNSSISIVVDMATFAETQIFDTSSRSQKPVIFTVSYNRPTVTERAL